MLNRHKLNCNQNFLSPHGLLKINFMSILFPCPWMKIFLDLKWKFLPLSLQRSGAHNRIAFLSEEIHPRCLLIPLQSLSFICPSCPSIRQQFCTIPYLDSACGGLSLHSFGHLKATVLRPFEIKPPLHPF